MTLHPHPDLTSNVISGLGWFYLFLFIINAIWCYQALKRHRHIKTHTVLFGVQEIPTAGFWAAYSILLLMISLAHFTGTSTPEDFPFKLPLGFKQSFDYVFANPVVYFGLSVIVFALVVWWRRTLANPTVAWVLLNVSLIFMALSMTDYDFRQIVGKPDNVPIVGMLYLVAFFTWIYFSRAVENDDRIAEGRPLAETEDNRQVLVWPDLVYTELICMVLLTALLVVWGVVLQAPLEEPANSSKTPNPSKAPWYFLGLQEMLVYFDPWIAGVVLPSVMIVGLMAIPYIDFNKKGNGYYCYEDRKIAVLIFMFGFLPLWIAMIILGTFLRGPNWNFFGIYEFWDVHKLEVANNVNLSYKVWVEWLGVGLPSSIFWRELPGMILVLGYFIVGPVLLATTLLKNFYNRMGLLRFMVFANLLLFMASLPIKMILRWTMTLKYLVAIPEWFFNI